MILKYKKRVLLGMLVLEAIAIFWSFIFYIRYQPQEYFFSYQDLSSPVVIEKSSESIYLEENEDQSNKGLFAETPEIQIDKGTYRVSFQYRTNSVHNLYYITCSDMAFVDYDRGIELSPHDQQQMFDMRVRVNDEKYKVSIDFNGEGYIEIKSITVTETKAYLRMLLGNFILFTILVNIVVYFILNRNDILDRNREKLQTCFVIAGICILVSLPIFTDYLQGVDIAVSLLRIEGLSRGILEGQIPVRIHPFALADHGYASGLFYPDLFLTMAALMRIWGYSVMQSYKFLLLCINILTVLISYYSFKRIFHNCRIGLVGCFFYSTSIYRMINIYPRGALGESIAMIFLPLLAFGLYSIIMREDNQDQGAYHFQWIAPTIALTGIIESHILSCAMTGIFIVLVCITQCRRVVVKKVFIQLSLTVIMTLLLNAWFIIPFVDSLSGDYVFQHMSEMTQNKGYYLQQLFSLYPIGDAFLYRNETIGLGIIIGLFVSIYIMLKSKSHYHDKYMRLGRFSIVFGCIALFMTTNLFPYDILYQMGGVFKRFVSSIQFPWRFSAIAILFITIAICTSIMYSYGNQEKEGYIKGLIIVAFFAIVFFLNGAMSEAVSEYSPLKPYGSAGVDTMDVSAGEYLPYQTDLQQLYFKDVYTSEGVTYSDYEKVGTHIKISVVNNQSVTGTVRVPLLFYSGYHARDVGTGNELLVYNGDNHQLQIEIPADYNGYIAISYCEKDLWIVADFISVITLIVIIICLVIRNRQERRSKEDSADAYI